MFKNILKLLAGAIGVSAIIMFLHTSYRQPNYPSVTASQQIHEKEMCPMFSKQKQQPEEERIAHHFSEDTLPGLLKLGLIKEYRRTAAGTIVTVSGILWNKRSDFFKQCLLRELLVYNTFYGYAISTQIKDSTTGKLYAQIAPSSKIIFFD